MVQNSINSTWREGISHLKTSNWHVWIYVRFFSLSSAFFMLPSNTATLFSRRMSIVIIFVVRWVFFFVKNNFLSWGLTFKLEGADGDILNNSCAWNKVENETLLSKFGNISLNFKKINVQGNKSSLERWAKCE